jgi:hypothetical protein
MTPPKTNSPLAYVVALAVAALMLGVGLGRFGIWQPAELRMADVARGDSEAPTECQARIAATRPPAQIAAVRLGFRRFGTNEVAGRLPTALLAILATLALALAAGRASDPRTGAYVGIAYATMPTVFMNARQMFGGGVAQSAFTLFLAAGIYVMWGRPPPGVVDDGYPADGKLEVPKAGPAAMLWLYGRWVLLAVALFAVAAAGWMLGVAPVLLGVGIAAMLRWRHESLASRVVGAALTVGGLVLTYLSLRATFHPTDGYSALTGVLHCRDAFNGTLLGPAAPRPVPTYDAYIEQIGHGLFPWTGLVAFGVVRLLFAPPTAGKFSSVEVAPGGVDGDAPVAVDIPAAWRESGMRVAAFVTLVVAFVLQSLYLQQFGTGPFIAAAPLAIAAGILLRDAEREAVPFRLVVAGATLLTVVMLRDYLLFPKSSFGALGLSDGGPAFPTGFTSTLRPWLKTHLGNDALVAIFKGSAPGEVYFLVEGVLFILIALSALFQGAGPVQPIGWARPYTWMVDVERAARAELEAEPPQLPPALAWVKYLTGFGILAYFRVWAGAIAALVVGSALTRLVMIPRLPFGRPVAPLSTQAQIALTVVGLLPVTILIGTYAVIALWNLFAFLGKPRGPVTQVLGSRVAFVAVGALTVGLVITQLYVPALSEHLSPRGVWTVIRSLRRSGDLVGRYGGQNDRATRYYAAADVRDLTDEASAVDFLAGRSPRRFVVVAADVFPSLNRAYRRRSSQDGLRQNIPIIDANNSNLYVASSELGGMRSRNPLDAVVLTTDTNNRRIRDRITPGQYSTEAWYRPHGRYADGRWIDEPARFDDAIEYLGYNLDANGQAAVPLGGSFKITYHFRMAREIAGDHQIFVHIDGPCPRINGDHPPVGGRYPVRYWLEGDFIHDEHTITVPLHCRAGVYTVYIGFFQGDDRMRVSGGEHDRENRVVAARINVR